MPKLGDVARSKDVGLGSSYHKCVWAECVDCGAQRWVLLRNGEPQSKRCYPCGRHYPGRVTARRGPDHWHWKGGRSIKTNGYAEVWVDVNDPMASMRSKDGYVLEHRLLMARHLGRALTPVEEVHHRNRDKLDNRIENLQMLSKREHAREPARRIAELEAEVAELRRLLDERPQAPPA